MRMALRVEEPSMREEVRQALNQQRREPTRWPEQTTQEKVWTTPPKGMQLRREEEKTECK